MKITSLTNPLVKHFVKLRTKKRYREEHNSVVVASKKLVEELSRHTAPKVVVTDASEAVFQKMTGQKAPEGVVAEFPLPAPSKLGGNYILVLDRITDPGNLGTLLRTALALSWDGVLLLPGCTDPFNEKAFTASRGALFKLPYAYGSVDQLSLPILVAAPKGTPFSPCKKCALVLGNEAHGSEVKGELITIPQSNEMESLNVAIAGGILMHGLTI